MINNNNKKFNKHLTEKDLEEIAMLPQAGVLKELKAKCTSNQEMISCLSTIKKYKEKNLKLNF